MEEPSQSRKDLLRSSASSFCQALLEPPPPAELIRKYFTPANPCITEHGPEWARSRLPFLSRIFSGLEGCKEYFLVLSQTLTMRMGADTFPGLDGYIVDVEATGEPHSSGGGKQPEGAVSVVGKATFTSIKTGKQWHEQFIYRFSGFDDAGRIGHWEIWADPLSAWVAVGED